MKHPDGRAREALLDRVPSLQRPGPFSLLLAHTADVLVPAPSAEPDPIGLPVGTPQSRLTRATNGGGAPADPTRD